MLIFISVTDTVCQSPVKYVFHYKELHVHYVLHELMSFILF